MIIYPTTPSPMHVLNLRSQLLNFMTYNTKLDIGDVA